MAGFTFRLQALLAYRESQRDVCRQRLGEAVQLLQQLADRAAALEAERGGVIAEMQALSGRPQLDIQDLSRRRYHAGQLQAQRLMMRGDEEKLRGHVERCRQALVEADQQVQALEKLREKARAEYDARVECSESIAREEAWLSQWVAGRSA